jgi:hypothetical protein
MITEKFIEQLKIKPGKRFELSDRSTTWAETKEVQRLAKNEFKKKVTTQAYSDPYSTPWQ